MTTGTTQHPPVDWKQLYKLAMLGLDPSKLPERIAEARHAILGRVEETLTRPRDLEHQQLDDALSGLRVLQQECERGLQEELRRCDPASSEFSQRKLD